MANSNYFEQTKWNDYLGEDFLDALDPSSMSGDSEGKQDHESGSKETGFLENLPQEVSIFGIDISTATLIGIAEITVGTGMVVGGAYIAVQSAGLVSQPAASLVVSGVQLIGIGAGTIASQKIIPFVEAFTPPIAGLEELNK